MSNSRRWQGAYGTFRHGAVVKTMKTVSDDYPWDFQPELPAGDFDIDELERTPTYDAVTSVYLSPDY